MEASPEPRKLTVGSLPPEPVRPAGNKVERMAQHSKGLVDDLTTWFDLKLKLTQLEVQHKVESKVSDVVVRVIPLVVFALAGLFFLVTVALGLGWLLGHPFWGFLIVTLLLGLTGVVLRGQAGSIKRRMVHEPTAPVSEDQLRPTDGRLPLP